VGVCVVVWQFVSVCVCFKMPVCVFGCFPGVAVRCCVSRHSPIDRLYTSATAGGAVTWYAPTSLPALLALQAKFAGAAPGTVK
jgi:hypothetical protein